MKVDIIESLNILLKALQVSKDEETDQKSIVMYNQHIETTENLIATLKKDGYNDKLVDDYFESEGRSYGWSFLPNENGKRAEEAFWNLKDSYRS